MLVAVLYDWYLYHRYDKGSVQMSEAEWLGTEIGDSLLRQECQRVRLALESIFGDQYLQIGSWGGEVFPKFARTKRVAVASQHQAESPDLVTQPNCLGIASDSVDIVLLPHVLEAHEDPYGVLRELDRVLRSDGYVVILGFNPVSYWGLRHLLSRRRFPPGCQRLISEHRLRDWLGLLNFSVDHSSFHYFPARRLRLIRSRRRRAEKTGQQDGAAAGKDSARRSNRLFRAIRLTLIAAFEAWQRHAPFAGCYMVVARKTLFTVTPLKPAWKMRPRFVGQLANPTTRNSA